MKAFILNLVAIALISMAYGQSDVKTDNSLLLDYYQNQRFADAADYLKKTYPEPVSNVKILSAMAYASQMAGRLPDAEGYYERIYTVDTTNTGVLYSLGSVNARRGNDSKAIFYYKKILLRDSTNFNVLKQMATLSRASGDGKTAIDYLKKANKINPQEPDVAYDLCAFYLNDKLYRKADSIVTIALRADTANFLLVSSKAQAVYRLGDYMMTVVLCNRLMQNGDKDGMVINMLAPSDFELKKYQDCIDTYKILEEDNTASETSYYYTAMSFKALGKLDTAIVYFNKAIKEALSVNVDSYYGEMADSYDQLHQPKKAVEAYQKSLLYGTIPLTYYAMAALYDAKLKNKQQALRYYKKYVASNPPENQRAYVTFSKSRISALSVH